ncbi:MAG: hypothetical protein L0H93_11865 [Nocardioides sp.]|nr:hypothetical protein [Nocardioides sp.]
MTVPTLLHTGVLRRPTSPDQGIGQRLAIHWNQESSTPRVSGVAEISPSWVVVVHRKEVCSLDNRTSRPLNGISQIQIQALHSHSATTVKEGG